MPLARLLPTNFRQYSPRCAANPSTQSRRHKTTKSQPNKQSPACHSTAFQARRHSCMSFGLARPLSSSVLPASEASLPSGQALSSRVAREWLRRSPPAQCCSPRHPTSRCRAQWHSPPAPLFGSPATAVPPPAEQRPSPCPQVSGRMQPGAAEADFAFPRNDGCTQIFSRPLLRPATSISSSPSAMYWYPPEQRYLALHGQHCPTPRRAL